jgi:hypothetical protein
MLEKSQYDFKNPFDDKDLPINNLSAERMDEIERLVVPKMKEAFNKLRQEQPHLFKSSSEYK